MTVYKKASNQVTEYLEQIKISLNEIYGYEVINHITSRIKTPDSILKKMKKKKYELNYQNLIYYINDIAGVRVVCTQKSDINTIINIIGKIPNVKIIKTQDYITKPQQSGYSGYHIIIETPVKIEDRELPVKVEIQVRTMAMDFWATNEHKLKYKTNKKISKFDSQRMIIYAKILNFIDTKIANLYQKQKIREIIY